MEKPKLLLLDIETAPAKAYVWGLWNQNVGLSQIIEPGRILCWGAKWVGKEGMYYADERRGTLRMVQLAHRLLSEADAVITYNGDKFDLPRLRGAFVEHGLDPTPPITSIDLIKTVRQLGAQSNKLGFIAPYLGLGDKLDTGGFSLWSDCLAGDLAAWRKMRRYNERDVRLLGRLYKVLRPYIGNHPRLFERQDRPTCGACGSRSIQFRGKYFARERNYDRFQCKACGKWDKVLSGRRNRVSPTNDPTVG